MSESQHVGAGTTTISTDYLRLITDAFERSLAAGHAPPIEWTEALQREHHDIIRKMQEEGSPCGSRSTNTPLYHRSTVISTTRQLGRTGKLHGAEHEELDHLQRDRFRNHPSHLDTSCSLRSRVECEMFPDEIIVFGNTIDNGKLSSDPYIHLTKTHPVPKVPKISFSSSGHRDPATRDARRLLVCVN
jgi:hypothetical protein